MDNNIVQNMLAAHISAIRPMMEPTDSDPLGDALSQQLQVVQLNWMIQKYYQNQLSLLQQLHQYQQHQPQIVAPPSPPGSSIADDQPTIPSESSNTEPEELRAEENCYGKYSISGDAMEHTPLEASVQEKQLNGCEEDECGKNTSPDGQKEAPPAAVVSGAVGLPVKSPRTTVRFTPYNLERRRRSIQLTALNLSEPLEVDLTYHENMARSFNNSAKECTPRERERRNRNTYAARVSRAKTRAINELLEKESSEAAIANQNWKRLIAQKRAYIGELLQLLGLPEKDLATEWGNRLAEGDERPAD